MQKTDEVVVITQTAGEAFSGIVKKIGDGAGMIHQIASAASEQSTTADSMSQEVESVSQGANKLAEATREIKNIAEQLDRMDSDLQSFMNQFKV
jgi:methyl-accepting chemotaxis protein